MNETRFMSDRFAQRVWLFFVSAVLVLPACEPSSPPASPSSALPATAPSATSSPTPGGEATTTSTLSTDEQVAIKAVERFYEALNKAMVSQSTKEFRTIYMPGCEACEQAASKIDATARAGRHIEGGQFAVTGVRVTGHPTNTRLLKLEGTVTSTPISILDSSGRVIEGDPGDSGPKFFILFRSENGWQMSGMGDI